MPSLWTFDEFDTHDPARKAHLCSAPSWPDLVQAIRGALKKSLDAGSARFGFDESGRDSRDLRGIVQFPLGRPLFDWVFNGTSGYRAQFRIGRDNGLAMNAQLVRELAEELMQSTADNIVIHRFTNEFIYKESTLGKIGQIVSTLNTKLSKVWICEKKIGHSGQVEELFVSRTGPKLFFHEADPWSSLYPEESDGWLDVKGAFLGQAGPYQIKSPGDRAAKLEERGTA